MYEGKLRFFTNITHEFSTPLMLIDGPCQRILESKNANASIKEYAGIIQNSSRRLNDLIQQIIDFRRIGQRANHIIIGGLLVSVDA